MKKRALSLIEMVIGLGLLSLIVTTLFFWYHSLSQHKERCKRIKEPLMEQRYCYQRLFKVIPKAEGPFFFTQDQSLVFTFDRGLYPIQELSGKVLARLYHDPEKECLCLGLWPLPKHNERIQSPTQTSILLDKVTQCCFELYHPPDPFQKPVDPTEVGRLTPRVGWQTEWRKEYSILPAFVKITILRDNERRMEYVFDLPVPVIYKGIG